MDREEEEEGGGGGRGGRREKKFKKSQGMFELSKDLEFTFKFTIKV